VTGEDVRHSIDHDVAAARARPTFGRNGRKRIRSIALSWTTATVVAIAWLLPFVAGTVPARARIIELESGRSISITVAVGKSENVHTDGNFVDVVVADPETADVMPLTDHSLSILGKKIGATRVSVYAEGKKLLGVFDVEVAYDTTKLGAEISRRFPHAQITVSSINGRIMLSGSAPDGITVDKAMTFAKQFGPEVINSVQVS
jgi:pilus assembly protein CpaC